MKRVFIKELSAYSVEGLRAVLRVSHERAMQCIDILTTRGVLRLRSGSDEDDYDSDLTEAYKGKYQFSYVGLTIIGDGSQDGEGLSIIVYPKYMDERDFSNNCPSLKSMEKLRQVFRVLRKCQGSYSDIATLTESSKRFNDRIACILMLVEMYAEYGEYSNFIKTLRINGSGDISWERTIALHQPAVQDGVPVYFECETIANTRDEADFITRLHRCILTECSKYLRSSGVSEILGLEEIEISDESLCDLGDLDHLLYRLDRERNVQYVTWKQDTIDLMKRYVSKEEMSIDSDEVICLGTNSFYHVWEQACKVALGDLLCTPIGNIGISLSARWKPYRSKKLIDIIPSPQWQVCKDGEYRKCGDVATLIPDTIAIWADSDGKSTFGIFDAKYYTPHLGTQVHGVPGVESVTKQILYQSAYRQFILDHDFDNVVNTFLVPNDGAEFELMGCVEFPGVFPTEGLPFASGVSMWKLPAERVWQCYLNGEKLSCDRLSTLFHVVL